LQVDFDPEQISFEAIANMFWQSHNPIGSPRSSQYKSAIWFASDDQLDIINSTIEPLVVQYERELTTEIIPLETFYNAEDYHQKYSLQRHNGLMNTFNAMYPEFRGFVNSTAAARLNGFAAGHGSPALFDAEKHEYGIEVAEIEKILRR
jgi:peptide-methionine (S)-S-oxide reductase